MRRGVAWLHAELPRLVELGVVTPETADALRRHYGPPDADGTRMHWGQMLLVCFGAVLVGGGVILILAHNWDSLGRPARAALALGMLIGAQALTIFAVARRSGSTAWAEATSGLLVAAVGAAIALVGQTYHVGGSFEGLMRSWLWLVVPIPYLTGSCLASIVFWGLLVVRAGSLHWQNAPADPWLLVFTALPFVALRVRRRPASWATALVSAAAAAAIFIVGSLIALGAGWGGLWAAFQVAFLGALIAAASWPGRAGAHEAWRNRIVAPAWIALIVVATILGFDDAWNRSSVSASQWRNANVVVTAGIAIACALFSSLATVALIRLHRFALAACAAAPALVIVTHALAIGGVEDAGPIAFNLWLLAAGSLTLVEGIDRLSLGTANRGLLALAALVLSRFFDTDLSFLVRGLGFVTLGIACFTLNIWLMRRLRTGAA
jgi:uncharacterized membrane protein